jgi:hypothetical protein
VLSQPPAGHGRMLFKGFGIEIAEDHHVALAIHIPLGDQVGVLHVEALFRPARIFLGGKGWLVCCVDVRV